MRRLPRRYRSGDLEEWSVADLLFAALLIASFALLAMLLRGLDKV